MGFKTKNEMTEDEKKEFHKIIMEVWAFVEAKRKECRLSPAEEGLIQISGFVYELLKKGGN